LRSSRHWYRRIWFANGVLLLLFLLTAAGSYLYDRFGPGYRFEAKSIDLDGVSADLVRAIRYGQPQNIYGTDVRMVLIEYGDEYGTRLDGIYQIPDAHDDYLPPSNDVQNEYRRGVVYTPLVNVAFLDPAGSQARLLLNKRAFIASLTYPSRDPTSRQPWISYDVAFDDLDNDGKLSRSDARGLYLSDLDGSNFRQVVADNYIVLDQWPDRNPEHIRIHALEAPQDQAGVLRRDQLVQRTLIHSLTTGETSLDTRLSSALEEAARRVSQ